MAKEASDERKANLLVSWGAPARFPITLLPRVSIGVRVDGE
jgi:hypothetical protein